MRSVTRLVRLSVSLVTRATRLSYCGVVWCWRLTPRLVWGARLAYIRLVRRCRRLAVPWMISRALVLIRAWLVRVACRVRLILIAGPRLSLVRSRTLSCALVERGTLWRNLTRRVETVLILEWWCLIVLMITMVRILRIDACGIQTVRSMTVSAGRRYRLLWRISRRTISRIVSRLTVRRRRDRLGVYRAWCLWCSGIVRAWFSLLGRKRNRIWWSHLEKIKSGRL